MLFCCFSFLFEVVTTVKLFCVCLPLMLFFSVPLFPQRRSSSLMGASWRPEKQLKRICWWFTPNATLTDWRSLSHLISLHLFIWKIFVHDEELPLLFVDGSFVSGVHELTSSACFSIDMLYMMCMSVLVGSVELPSVTCCEFASSLCAVYSASVKV